LRSALSAIGLTTPHKRSSHTRAGAAGKDPTSSSSWRRHRHLEYRRLSPRHDGRPHAEPRQRRAKACCFTDYYGEASCTAAAPTHHGELPIRTGMTTVASRAPPACRRRP